MIPIAVLIAGLFAAPVTMIAAGQIDVEDGIVRVRDVASLAGLRPEARAAVAERTIARIPPGRGSFTLSRAALSDLLGRAVPGLDIAPAGEGVITLRFARTAAGSPARACFVLASPVATGAVLAADDVAQAPCRDERAADGVTFDRRDRTARARLDLPAGTYLASIRLEPRAVAAGDPLTLVSSVGPVRIERPVVALQRGRPGGRLFVRTEQGGTLAVDLPSAPAGEDGR